jgi:hypothetical protein
VTISEGQQQELTYTLLDAIESHKKNGAVPFPLEPTQIGDIYYMANVHNPYSVEVVWCCTKPRILIPDSILYNGNYYNVVSISHNVLQDLYHQYKNHDIITITLPLLINLSLACDKYKIRAEHKLNDDSSSYNIQTEHKLNDDGSVSIPCLDWGFSDRNYISCMGSGDDQKNIEGARGMALQAAKNSIQYYMPNCRIWSQMTHTGEKTENIIVTMDIPTTITLNYAEKQGVSLSVYRLRSILAKEWDAFCNSKYELTCEKCFKTSSGLFECWIAIQLPKTIVQDFIVLMKEKGILSHDYEN